MAANRPAFLEDGELSLLLFGGKGGVGKTTCAVATALHLAEQFPDRTFLLASSDPAHSLNDSLAGSLLPANLQVREIDFRQSLEEFKQAHVQHFRQVALRGTFLDEQDVAKFLDLSTPGFDELMAFLEIAKLWQERSYSCLVIDTAPTGHTLRLLELPELMRTWIGVFGAMLAKHHYLTQLYGKSDRQDDTDVFLEQLQASVDGLASLLSDPVHCRFIPVLLAETMSVNETQRLVTRLQELKIAVTDLLVNRLYPAQSDCPVCREAGRRQQRELRRTVAQFAGLSVWGLPLYGGEVRGAEQLTRFWDGLDLVRDPPAPSAEQIRLSLRVEPSAPLPDAGVRFLLFAGKGGVGKTTLACASALQLAQVNPDKRVLLFSTDPAHSLADCLDRAIGPREVPLAPGLSAMEIDAEAEFEKLKERYLQEVEKFFGSLLSQSGIELEFDHEVVERILDLSPPGLDEVMALLRAVALLDAKKYDIFVLDTAPTGHLIRLLETPELIDDWLKAVFGLFLKYRNIFRLPKIVDYLIGLSKQLKLLRSLLCDPQQAQLFAVSILTEMAFAETCDLLAACKAANVHVPTVFLNLATPPGACPLCSGVAASEAEVRSRFAKTFGGVPQSVVYRCGEPRGLDRLAELGQMLYAPRC